MRKREVRKRISGGWASGVGGSIAALQGEGTAYDWVVQVAWESP